MRINYFIMPKHNKDEKKKKIKKIHNKKWFSFLPSAFYAVYTVRRKR